MNKSWLSIEKNEKKHPIIVIRNYFNLRNLDFSWCWARLME